MYSFYNCISRNWNSVAQQPSCNRVSPLVMAALIIYLNLLITIVSPLVSVGEAFILDRELGMFACQSNPNKNSLSLYNISSLCDGVPHCLNGLDEDRIRLQCKNDCYPPCVHGTCLKGPQCYCDCDWGGKDCNIPDINECKNTPCHHMAFCTNTLGSFYCTCLPGFTGNGFECKDIDECNNYAGQLDNSPIQFGSLAGAVSLAQNNKNLLEELSEQSSYTARNSQRHISSLLLQQQQSPSINLPNHMRHHPYVKRDVEEGIALNRHRFVQDNEPHRLPANPSTTSSYNRDNNRFAYDNASSVPQNLASTVKACAPDAKCFNVPGSYYCACSQGFIGDGYINCADINECNNPLACESFKNARCVNNIGTYRCECLPGYKLENGVCEDINECSHPYPNKCHRNARCINKQGSFECRCTDGFIGTGQYCQDIDECRETLGKNCHEKAICTNNEGGFDCSCRAGYTGNGKICHDIDECREEVNSTTGQRYCHMNAECTNSDGAYECKCKLGFYGDGTTNCEDIDECQLSRHNCVPPARCVNSEGAYVCSCPPGFTQNGNTCLDINECDVGTHSCGRRATCINKMGGYDCVCPDGFSGNPFAECQDDHSCDPTGAKPNSCSLNSECLLSNGSPIYKCTCNKGFKGNGTFCEDINECQENPNICDPAVCMNSIGAYFCTERLANQVASPPKTLSRTGLSNLESNSVIHSLNNYDLLTSQDLTSYRGLHRTVEINPNDLIQMGCRSDGIDVKVDFSKFYEDRPFNGILYVKGNFKMKQCRKSITQNTDTNFATKFFIKYGDCSFDINLAQNEYSTILVIQPHLTLLTHDAKAYKLYCYYHESEMIVSNDLNISSTSPDQILKATGSAPPCKMEVLDANSNPVMTTDLGAKLQLRISLLANERTKYGLIAKNCFARTMTEDWEYQLVDERGCSTDSKLFEDFQYNTDGSIRAFFSAFKFPNSVYMRFKCDVKICFGNCEPVQCNGSRAYQSFGRYKRHQRYDLVNLAAEVDNLVDDPYRFDNPANTTTKIAKKNMVEKVESVLMKINEKIEEDDSVFYEDFDDPDENAATIDDAELFSNKITDMLLGRTVGANSNPQNVTLTERLNKLNRKRLRPYYSRGGNETMSTNPRSGKSIRRYGDADESLNPSLTCVSKAGLATGLSLTVILTALGATVLAVSVKRQITIQSSSKRSKSGGLGDYRFSRSADSNDCVNRSYGIDEPFDSASSPSPSSSTAENTSLGESGSSIVEENTGMAESNSSTKCRIELNNRGMSSKASSIEFTDEGKRVADPNLPAMVKVKKREQRRKMQNQLMLDASVKHLETTGNPSDIFFNPSQDDKNKHGIIPNAKNLVKVIKTNQKITTGCLSPQDDLTTSDFLKLRECFNNNNDTELPSNSKVISPLTGPLQLHQTVDKIQYGSPPKIKGISSSSSAFPDSRSFYNNAFQN